MTDDAEATNVSTPADGSVVEVHDDLGEFRSLRGDVWRQFKRHKGAVLGQITTLPAEVMAVEFMGAVIRLRLQSGGQALALDTFNRFDHAPPMVGDHVAIEFNPRDLIVLAA